MILKIIGSPSDAVGPTLRMCDDDGNPLPNQQAVSVDQCVGDPTTVTVRFVVDGKRVRIER